MGKKQRDAALHKLDPIRTDTDFNFYKLYYLMDLKAHWQPEVAPGMISEPYRQRAVAFDKSDPICTNTTYKKKHCR